MLACERRARWISFVQEARLVRGELVARNWPQARRGMLLLGRGRGSGGGGCSWVLWGCEEAIYHA